MTAGAFTPAQVKHLFYTREHEACFRCGRALRFHERGFAWSVHHRMPRGMGGSKTAQVASLANALVICGSGTTGCHGDIESRRAIAEDHGYLVRRGINPPSGIRIKKLDGTWWLLTDTGLAVEVEREGEEWR